MCCFAPFAGTGPTVITVPGLGGSGAAHWQTRWEHSRLNTIRAELDDWAAPQRNRWVTRLDEAVRQAEAPVILAAHSLGCLAVAWWARLIGQPYGWPVAGALLVAPPDVEGVGAPEEIRGFAPAPAAPLPFPSILVASADDPWITVERAHSLAVDWGSRFVAAGSLGHINAESGLGDWPAGQALLDTLVAGSAVSAHAPASLGERRGARIGA